MIYTVALIFTVIGWGFQFYRTVIKKDKSISPVLPIVYTIACIMFAYNSFITGGMTNAILDVVCAIFALAIFVILVKRKK